MHEDVKSQLKSNKEVLRTGRAYPILVLNEIESISRSMSIFFIGYYDDTLIQSSVTIQQVL
jgi:hypothetical protein